MGFVFNQVDTIADQVEALHGQIHGHRLHVGHVGHVALPDFPPITAVLSCDTPEYPTLPGSLKSAALAMDLAGMSGASEIQLQIHKS